MSDEKLDFNEWKTRLTIEMTRHCDPDPKTFVPSQYLVRLKGDPYDEFEIRFNYDGNFFITNWYSDESRLVDDFQELLGILSLDPEKEIYAGKMNYNR